MQNKDSKKLSLEELDAVTGGEGGIMPMPSDSAHGYWFTCPHCQGVFYVNDELEEAAHTQNCHGM